MTGDPEDGSIGHASIFEPVWPIRPIEWAAQTGGDPASPFHPESKRPIRLTLHTESLVSLDAREADALAALTELARMKDVEALETAPGMFPQIVVEPDRVGDHYPVTVNYPDGSRRQLGISVEDEAARIPFREASIVLAHKEVCNDLFVTAHPWILRNATRFLVFRNAAIMPPTAAARIVGLLLRRRQNYHVTPHFLFQGGYHFYLMRYVLSGLWRYFSACTRADGWEEGTPASLGAAILIRAERALEARDAIAFEYYGGGAGAIRRIEYHFDYLMLLLNGALDAQARIAFAAYGLKTPKGDANRNFRNKEYLHALGSSGGTGVVQVVERNCALTKVIAHLRNTIHGSSLQGVSVNKMTPEAFHLEVPTSMRVHLERLVETTTGRAWGLTDDKTRPLLSPYVFADSALREVFHLINEIAVATEVERLLVEPASRLALTDGPPDDEVFGDEMGKRLVAIGW